MPCVCKQCFEHARTLGLGRKVLTRTVIHKAFRTEAKRWHPDRFENQPVRRFEAEEHFKVIQVAYRELWEHCESPVREALEEPGVDPGAGPSGAEEFWTGEGTRTYTASQRVSESASQQASGSASQRVSGAAKEEPGIFFGGARGCYTAPHFPRSADEIFMACPLEGLERVLGLIQASGRGAGAGDFSRFILLTSYRIFVRDAARTISLLWYHDLGEVRFIDSRRHGRSPLWRWVVGKLLDLAPKYCLEIGRRDGTIFYSVPPSVDDTVHKVLYNFLQQKKPQTN